MIDKNRLLAITDGIVAIAATIMVLQLVIPEEVTMAAVISQWPTLLAYIISFVQVFLAWHEHHDSIANAEYINHRIFLINCMWLFFITLLPFVTGVVGHSPQSQAAMLLYILILFLVQLSITIESLAITKLNETIILDYEVIRVIRIISFIGYILAAAGTFISPFAAYIIILALSIAEIILMCAYDIKIGKLIKNKKAGE
ncbi:MAG: TMEM175 family protein [Bacillota bacterium]|nr:TMEM175 family protein [Bacillota bacterium]